MSIDQEVTREPPTRQERLSAWLHREGITLAGLTDCAGLHVSVALLSRTLRQDTMPVRHHHRLVAFGVPAELLPYPVDRKPGRKPKIRPITQEEALAAFRGA